MNSCGWTKHELSGMDLRKRFFLRVLRVMGVMFRSYVQPLFQSILFQILSSGVMFGLSVLAIKEFGAAGHGLFVLMLSGIMMGLSVFTALLLDPFSQRGRVSFMHGQALQSVLGWLGLGAFGPGMLLMWIAESDWALLFVSGVLFSPGLAAVFLQRRLVQAGTGGRRSAWVWAGLCLFAVGCILLSGYGTPCALAAVPSVAGLVFLARPVPVRSRVLKALLVWHIRRGYCLVLALPVTLVMQQGTVLAVASSHGPEGAGDWRLVQLLMFPVLHVVAAVGGFLQPRLARLVRQGYRNLARVRTVLFGTGVVILSCVWFACLGINDNGLALLHILLPSHGLTEVDIVLACACAVTMSLAAGTGLFTRACCDNRRVLLGGVCAGSVCAVGLPSCAPHGVGGVLFLQALSHLTNAVVLAWPRR